MNKKIVNRVLTDGYYELYISFATETIILAVLHESVILFFNTIHIIGRAKKALVHEKDHESKKTVKICFLKHINNER